MLKRLFGTSSDAETAEEQVEEGLEKTRSGWRERLASVFGPVDITEDTWDELEARLVQADVGVATAEAMVEATQSLARDAGVRRASELWRVLRHVMVSELQGVDPLSGANGAGRGGDRRDAAGAGHSAMSPDATATELGTRPWVMLMIGVNGTGKTTTIAKLAARALRAGRSVALVAADTFRAAAIEQLQVWGDRVGVPVLAGSAGADPASVTYDALESRIGKDADLVIVDTAGRLHTQSNLMAELEKINRVCARAVEGAPHETLLVLDATTGQNGLMQAKAFTRSVGLTGIVLAKLDSSAKGGVAFAVQRELGVPILWIGTGEGIAHLAPFDAEAYVEGILGEI